MRLFMIISLLLISIQIYAQDRGTPPPIAKNNFSDLQSVNQISFDMLQAETVDNQVGWFVYHPVAQEFMVMNAMRQLVTLDEDGIVLHSFPITDRVDVVPFATEFYAILSNSDDGFSILYTNSLGTIMTSITVISDAFPNAIWVTCDNESFSCQAFVEATNDSETVVFELPAFDTRSLNQVSDAISDSDLIQIAYLPNNDDNAVVRIGRISLPYVVTSSLDGIVTLWDLEAQTAVYQADNGTGEPSVFGNINASVSHLIWRDNANQTLYLLNFETGENQVVAPLDGDYAQWYFLSDDASVIIAVNLGGDPNVIAWDVETGERTNLGHYRACDRPQPDMARLTADGTTLIIGCDSGLDIWQIR